MRNAASAIHNYFAYRADITGRELRFTLLIGLVFLLACLLSAQHLIATMGKTGLFWLFIREGVLITGWVAMWRPIDLFLYAWWPIRRRRRIYWRYPGHRLAIIRLS